MPASSFPAAGLRREHRLAVERGSTGIADDVRNLFTSLMNSAGHRANILSASYDYVGIGVERGDFGAGTR